MSSTPSKPQEGCASTRCQKECSPLLASSSVRPVVIRSDDDPPPPPKKLPSFVAHGSHWTFYDTINVGVAADDDYVAYISTAKGDQSDASPDAGNRVGGAIADTAAQLIIPDKDTTDVVIQTPCHLHHLLGHAEAIAGTGHHCTLWLCLGTGSFELFFEDEYRGKAPEQLGRQPEFVTISISFLSEGRFHEVTLCASGSSTYKSFKNKGKTVPVKLRWKFDSIDSTLQRLLHEASKKNIIAHLAVTGHSSMPFTERQIALHPGAPSTDKLLMTVSKLMTADEASLVRLKAMQDNPLDETLVASKSLLSQRCDYFRAMFQSQFSEARTLSQSQNASIQPAKVSVEARSTGHEAKEAVILDQHEGTSLQQEDASCPPLSREEASTRHSPCDNPADGDSASRGAPSFETAVESAADGATAEAQRAGQGDPVHVPQKRRRASVGERDGDEAGSASSAVPGRNSPLPQPVIELFDVDPVTLQALVFYLYTGTCMFRSQKHGQVVLKQARAYWEGIKLSKSPWSDGMRLCDAEKMYQAADMYGQKGLQILAKHHVISELEVSTAFKGLFANKLAQLYDEMRQAYIDFCVEHFSEISKLDSYHETMAEIFSGTYPPSAAKSLQAIITRVTTNPT
ncbi:uncharacterized protein PFL1_06308 [Pseudozyma flocculosa PF-1]|uniref:BTB domain-containing protein n=1 Tax=Pseudozyma flocculosa PF-1 TaxID=1277687 RepID=A0A061H2Q8_9BASI|nr:uncharacterized protein PFL1_06308 [Pseudozyma flocculosa PF-1]EPQ26100.1 hypothetical protein PFL1_06308 [Pseudozyma flocculosa PF-1]